MPSFNFLKGGQTPNRSLTPAPAASEPPPLDVLTKSQSTPIAPTMTAVGSQRNGSLRPDSGSMNTIPDPRARTPSPTQEPDLSNEVSMLSTKLINAINHSTNLDDTLQHTRHDLDAVRKQLAQAQLDVQRHADMITNGVLVKKAAVDAAMVQLRAEMAEARQQREAAEKGKKEMETELENLTSALFEEANTMVAAARRESEAVEKRNTQLRSQLEDTELLLASQQEQLQDLKGVMERMSSERDETETNAHSLTAPSTPGVDSGNKMSSMLESLTMSPGMHGVGDVPPDQPLRFSHLITPVLRSDVQAYADFVELLKTSHIPSSSHSRSPSGAASISSKSTGQTIFASSASSNPILPGSFNSVTSSPRDNASSTLPPLGNSKFYKRCLVEDIEPTLRLDLAPGLSFFARRTVMAAVATSTLMVEPFIPQSRYYGPVYSCALCGESRRTDVHARRHRFRTSEDESAPRYPLCEFCLGRIRATGDYVGFLRMVRDGLWRAGSDEEVKGAWEESVRLREKMFWARLGGGVVPASGRGDSPMIGGHRRPGMGLSRMDSSTSSIPRTSRDESRVSEDSDGPARNLSVPRDDPFRSTVSSTQRDNRVSIGRTMIERPSALNTVENVDATGAPDLSRNSSQHEMTTAPVTPTEDGQQMDGPRDDGDDSDSDNNNRRSGTIPGSFE